jgi:hypothetical protein
VTELADFLRARYIEQRAALTQFLDGHDGPCLNYPEQDPEHYDEFDSCYRHIEVAQATPYRDATYGLADIAAKLAIIDDLLAERHHVNDGDCWYTCPAATEERDGGETCDDSRHGYPCDCGRDAGIERRLRLLALPFVGHPEYKEGWRP